MGRNVFKTFARNFLEVWYTVFNLLPHERSRRHFEYEMKHEDLKYLAVALPEDILKEKWSGHFDRVREIIARRLAGELTYDMRCRLELELTNLEHLEKCYNRTEAEALAMVQERIPSFTAEELDELRLENKVDFIYLNGEVRYLRSFCSTLFKVYPEMEEREAREKGDAYEKQAARAEEVEAVDQLVENLVDGQETSAHIHIRQKVWINEDALEEGKPVRIHVPLPVERQQMKNVKVISVTPQPKAMPSLEDGHPVAYFEEKAKAGQVFSVEYSLDHVTHFVNLSWEAIEKLGEEKGDIPAEEAQYLCEQLAHIQFTPYLRGLAESLKDPSGDLLKTARRIYDYVTTKVTYRFVRDYAAIDNLSEYCAVNLRGDCGIQALLFITLCRICGIPARWQSGLDTKPGSLGQHDWALFYLPSKGWLGADLSYGGSAYKKGKMKRWDYFFGNVDPFRVPINDSFQAEMVPVKKFPREDPCDNQCGELEYEDRGLYGSDWGCDYEEIDIHRIK